jgi:hypothetical protein
VKNNSGLSPVAAPAKRSFREENSQSRGTSILALQTASRPTFRASFCLSSSPLPPRDQVQLLDIAAKFQVAHRIASNCSRSLQPCNRPTGFADLVSSTTPDTFPQSSLVMIPSYPSLPNLFSRPPYFRRRSLRSYTHVRSLKGCTTFGSCRAHFDKSSSERVIRPRSEVLETL